MSDERLIELAKQIKADMKSLQASGPSLKLADAILDELEPEPLEWRGKKATVRLAGAFWFAEVGSDHDGWVQLFGRTRAQAVRRLNAATRAIDEMEGVKS